MTKKKMKILKPIIIPLAGHIGSNDTQLNDTHMNAIQSQMQSKGGYETNSLRIQVHNTISDLKCRSFSRVHKTSDPFDLFPLFTQAC